MTWRSLSVQALLRGRRLVLLRAPNFAAYPDGDAMNGFSNSTFPAGLVVRLTHCVLKVRLVEHIVPVLATSSATLYTLV